MAALSAGGALGVVGLTGPAAAAPTLSVTPATNLTAGEKVTVTGSGFAASGIGGLLECNTDPTQPTIEVDGVTQAPVGCSNPLGDVVTADSNGDINSTFSVLAGVIGPPATGTDSIGNPASQDAQNYPCPPTPNQTLQGVTCSIAYGQLSGDQGTATISFPTAVASSLPSVIVGDAYAQGTVTGGIGPYTAKVTSGSLPPGLTMATSGADAGQITGTPTTPGTYTFSVQGTDSTMQSASGSLSIQVLPMAISTTSLPQAFLGASYDQTLGVNGGFSPYTWSVSSGTLPPGLKLDPSTGEISGNPTSGGSFNFTVEAQDSGNPTNTATQALTINVVTPKPTVTIAVNPPSPDLNPPGALGGQPLTITVTVAPPPGGPTPTGTVVISDQQGSLCTFCTLPPGSDQVTQTISTAGTFSPGTYDFQASYGGNSIYDPATATLKHYVIGAKAKLQVELSPSSPQGLNKSVAVKVALLNNPSVTPPTGYVTVSEDGKPLCSVATLHLDANGQANASCHTKAIDLGVGRHRFQVTYSGDPRYPAMTSPKEPFVVKYTPTVTETSSLSGPVPPGTSLTLKAHVAGPYKVPPPATGTVNFLAGKGSGVYVCFGVPLQDGVAVCHTTTKVYTSSKMWAHFNGAYKYFKARSKPIQVKVVKPHKPHHHKG